MTQTNEGDPTQSRDEAKRDSDPRQSREDPGNSNLETPGLVQEPGQVTVASHEFEVPAEFDGQRLDRFLVSVLAEQSRSQLQRLIGEGHVSVSTPAGRAKAAKANLALKEGDRVQVDAPAPRPADIAGEELPLEVLYQDADVAVIDKPAGMVVHPAAGHDSGTLVNALLHHITDLSGIGGERRPGIVHRLDRGTSGVMVIAKNDAAHQELARQFHDREIEKEYIALVWGVVQAGRRIDAAIGRDPANRQKMSARSKHARNAVTRITRAHHMPAVTLCQVAIHTGRTHQIRVHLSAIGHPIVGDSLYGGVHRRVAGDIRAVQRLTRPFLHAARLVFHHPRDGRRLEFIAPLPADLMNVLEELPGWPPEES
jgi:23S rRNA pseudouridine1911/1915/1917 synthase